MFSPVFIITSAKKDIVIVVVCRFVRLLATLRENFRTDLHEIFWEGWQRASEQKIKFCWRSGSLIRIRIDSDTDTDLDLYRDTSKTCLGGSMHRPSASSYGRPM